jgi:hypothetical protein
MIEVRHLGKRFGKAGPNQNEKHNQMNKHLDEPGL